MSNSTAPDSSTAPESVSPQAESPRQIKLQAVAQQILGMPVEHRIRQIDEEVRFFRSTV